MVEHLPSMCEVLINNWKKRREKGGKRGKKEEETQGTGKERGEERKGGDGSKLFT